MVFILSGCVSTKPPQPEIIYKTEYVSLPATYFYTPEIPKRIIVDEVPVDRIVDMGFRLRTSTCAYRSRLKEVIRQCTWGETILPDPTEEECPTTTIESTF